MTNPIPSTQQQLDQILDVYIRATLATKSETKTAVQQVLLERTRQIGHGYDAAHDLEHGQMHLVQEAFSRVDGVDVSRQQILEAAALLLAAVEVTAYWEES
jgi:hypothetical protein